MNTIVFKSPRVLLAVTAVLFALLCEGACAQDFFGPQPSGPTVAKPARPAQPASAVQKHFDKGLQLLRQGKVDQAITEFQAAKKLQPNQPAILVNLGLCYMQKRSFSAAESAFRQAIDLDPKGKNPATKFAFARLIGVLSAQGKDSQAVAMAKKYVALAPKDYDARFSLGVCYLQAKSYSSAASAFKSALAIKPNDPAATQNLGFALINGKNYAEAKSFFEKSLARKDDPQVRAMAAYACEQMGDKKAALAHYDKIAWKRLPQSPQAVMSMVRIHNAMNKPAEASKVLAKAGTFYKKDFAIQSELGRQLMMQGKYKEAETALLAARSIRSDVTVNTNLALVCINLKKLPSAGTYAQSALKAEPKNKQAIELYAYILNSVQKNDKAIAQYRNWEKYYPKDPTPNIKIGGALLTQGKNDEAHAEYQKAMKKAPKDASVMVSAAVALRSMNKVDESISLLQKAAATDPKHEPAMATLAEIYESQQKTDLAIEQYKKMIAVNPKSKQSYQRLARAYESKKDYAAAAEQYRKLCEFDPTDVNSAISVAKMQDEAGKLDDAIAEIKKVCEKFPKDDGARVCYGDMLVKKQDYAGALTQFEPLTKSEDTRMKSYGHFKVGETRAKEGKHEEAIAAFKTCLEGVPSNTQALDAMSKSYDELKKSDEFLAYLKTQVETGSEKAPYSYFVTKYKAANKAEEAAKTLEPLAEKSPDNKMLQMSLTEAYKASNSNDKAIERYKAMIAKNPDDVMLEIQLCDLYKTAGKDQEAVDAITALLKKVPDYAKLHIDLGDLYVKMDKKTEAEAAYNAALKLQPTNQLVKDKITALTAPPPAPTSTPPAPGPTVAPAPAPTAEPTPTPAPGPTPNPSPTPTPAPEAAPAAK